MTRLATAFMFIALSAPAATTPTETINWTAGVTYTYDGSGKVVS